MSLLFFSERVFAMPEYTIVKPVVVHHEGHSYSQGDSVVLHEDVAHVLGENVVPTNVAVPEKAFAEMTLKELKPLAKSAGVESYSTKDKGELVEALEGLQNPEAVTEDDERDGNPGVSE